MFMEKDNEENNQIRHLPGRTLAGVGMMFAQAPVVNIPLPARKSGFSAERYRSGVPEHQPNPTGERW
jgi:hypothetical protein